jgi:hypothetical protein
VYCVVSEDLAPELHELLRGNAVLRTGCSSTG